MIFQNWKFWNLPMKDLFSHSKQLLSIVLMQVFGFVEIMYGKY